MTAHIKFKFNSQRALEACAVLMGGKRGSVENYTKLLKLLYLADRKALLDTGRTITGDTYVCMKMGPVLSEVYRRFQAPAAHEWKDIVTREGQWDVTLNREVGDDHLTDYEVELLASLRSKYQHHDYSDMVDIVHELSEWNDPEKVGKRSLPLPASDILRAAYVPNEEIEAVAKTVAYFGAVEKALA